MRSFKSWFAAVIFLFYSTLNAQEKRQFKVHTVAFYNVENLFDTINDPNKFDEASPIMEMNFNRQAVYEKKVENMARVISEIGYDVSKNSPVIIGLAEVENRQVLEDLANDESLIDKNYGIVHFDSPDARGIDVALLYQKKYFTPLMQSNHELKIYDDVTRKRVYTRDQLLVSGRLDGELMYFIVNHWPSRRGGEARSRPKRVAAAKLNKRIIDSLQAIDPYAKIFTMGDLNDDPTNASVKEILKAERKKEKVKLKGIFNPMENLARKGLGTNAYRDGWSLFDQILFTQPLLEKDYGSFRFYKAGIFNKNYLTNKKGRWKGYPLRSFADGGFTNGFSDHFPVYVTLIKEVSSK
ncbi:MAG: endonuclease/exonuclease/phosphatase family protein [Bacteroidia bacterium]|nr:endonuclease/exonuclease/phosphatase family protein [Bacteroidia bacterium]MBT8268622.1 endonuclease/exonuclease/phosphatase family protein [Bacteroidia bacterium]NNF82931.1 endonuclease/exonuclease/phosphatase family protein [Flavobacteriaceae bacterium]NNK70197.1 endonuclease/exonuclease/phosphatase family protein [Flavobacteriaceae bacterium]NNL81145.1 endonuclease/exonuclease/phosphatase family protein [Flavobacteriaceae bacterium]